MNAPKVYIYNGSKICGCTKMTLSEYAELKYNGKKSINQLHKIAWEAEIRNPTTTLNGTKVHLFMNTM